MRILVFGGSGRLGRAVCAAGERAGHYMMAPLHVRCDTRNVGSAEYEIGEASPDYIVDCAMPGMADALERPTTGMAMDNLALQAVRMAQNVARAAAFGGIPHLYVSSDFVFDMNGQMAFEGDPVGPINRYGRAKVAAEQIVLLEGGTVVRTAGLYGSGDNFVHTMLLSALARVPSTVTDDVVTSPTHVDDLADWIVRRPLTRGCIYHKAGAQHYSWYQMARQVYDWAGAHPGLVTPGPVNRPAARGYGVMLSTVHGEGLPGFLERGQDYLTALGHPPYVFPEGAPCS